MANLEFDHNLKRITVTDPQTEVTIQDLYNQGKDEEDFPHIAMTTGLILTATGKESLGGGIQVGVTLVMRNGWKVGFGDRGSPTQCNVTGGNIVAESEVVGDQFFQSVNVQINYQSSASPTIASRDDTNVKFLLESNRPDHTGFGKQIYWSPVLGNDGLTGESPENAVKTFAQAHSLADVGGNDVIFALGDPAVAVTIVTERITITKSALFLRGTGPAIRFQPETATDGSPIIDVQSGGFALESVSVFGSGTGTDDSIKCTNTNGLHVFNCLLSNAQGDSISIDNSRNSRVENTAITNSLGNGINAKDTNRLLVKDCRIFGSTLNGLLLDTPATATNDVILENTIITNSTGKNLRINSGVNRTIIEDGCTIVNNGGGRLQDDGTGTVDAEIINAVNTITTGSKRSLNV